MKFLITSLSVLLLSTGIYADIETLQDTTSSSGFVKCLENDSISCLQMTLYRRAKTIFDNPQIEIFGGVSLVKSNEGRKSKSLDDNSLAVELAPSVESRNSELGSYFVNSLKNFFQERSLSFNFANTARSIAQAIPEDIKSDINDLVVEGRTKKKRILKKLLPIILGIGAKVAVLAVGSMFGLLLLAKKALIVSVVAFGLALLAGISGLGRGAIGGGGGGGGGLLGGLGGLFGGGKGNSGAGGYSSGSGWSAGGGGGWNGGSSGWDSHGAYSSPVAQSVAYSGYKQTRR